VLGLPEARPVYLLELIALRCELRVAKMDVEILKRPAGLSASVRDGQRHPGFLELRVFR
jgi:hypothetical protein